MTKGTIEFDLAHAPAVVFALISDLERAPEWVPDLVSVEKLSAGPTGVGTRYRQVVKMGKKRGEGELQVTEHDAPRRFAHTGQGGPSRFSARFTLEQREGGTRVRHEYTVELKGLFKLMTPMIEHWVKTNAEQAVENLRRTLAGEAR